MAEVLVQNGGTHTDPKDKHCSHMVTLTVNIQICAPHFVRLFGLMCYVALVCLNTFPCLYRTHIFNLEHSGDIVGILVMQQYII